MHDHLPGIPQRRSVRLKGYDYAQNGAYFVTLCAHQRKCLFGEIVVGARRTKGRQSASSLRLGGIDTAVPDSGVPEMILNNFGNIVVSEWLKTATIHSRIELGEFVVMPNHFHGILVLRDDEGAASGTARREMPGTARRAPTGEQFGKPVAGSVSTIVRSFKSAVTKCINEVRNTPGAPIWQRNYHEHIIRNEADYSNIAEYIANNPQQWAEDSLNSNASNHPVGARRAVPGTSRRAMPER